MSHIRTRQLVALLLMLVFSVSLLASPKVEALSEEQKQIFNSGVYFFNAADDVNSSGCSGDTVLTGSANAEQIFNYFIGKGLTAFQAAGIVGNMSHESGLEPQRLQGTAASVKTPAESLSAAQLSDNRLGWGLVQFTPPGKFINNVADKSSANLMSTQLDFIWNQLTGQGPSAESPQILADIRASTTVEEAVLAFQGNLNVGGRYIGYERPADQNGTVARRTATARSIMAKFGSNVAGITSSDTTTCGGSSNEVVGNLSLPLAKTWYSQHKDWFTKPHHDYPAADIPVPAGTPVYSMSDGKVTSAPVGDSCGNGVQIDAGEGVTFLYCHGQDGGSIVKAGDQVRAGQLIMHSGYTGHIEPPGPAGAHLHVQIGIAGQNHCPQPLLVGIAEGSIPNLKDLPTTGCSY